MERTKYGNKEEIQISGEYGETLEITESRNIIVISIMDYSGCVNIALTKDKAKELIGHLEGWIEKENK